MEQAERQSGEFAAMLNQVTGGNPQSNTPRHQKKLLNSPTFMESVKDAIGKEAFMRDYEITTKQVNFLAEKMVRELHGKVKTAEKKTESAEEYAKRYFREHYNPNRGQREITSSTYERAQRRLNENVDSYFGRGMEKKRRKHK